VSPEAVVPQPTGIQPHGSQDSAVHRLRRWYERRRSGRLVVAAWVVTRLVMFALMATLESFVVGDVFYYWRKIDAMSEVGLANTLYEYPTPVVWILWVPHAITGGSSVGYLVAFIAMMLVLDAVFTWLLWRAHGRRSDTGVDFWLLFVMLVGPLSYLRFDILPAVLAGGALLAARRRPWVTGALTGLGAAIKLWPALLIPAFLAHRPARRPAGTAFLVVGVGLALLSLVTGGWSRLVSPLTWQSGRGLQIESIWATPVMAARALRPGGWRIEMSPFQAYEIFGPAVSPLLLLSNLATVVGLLVIIGLFVRGFRLGNPSATAVGMVILATVAIMTVTNKTLSPQYLLWMGGPMAALLVLRRDLPAGHRTRLGRLAWQLLGLALLTHLVYPSLYDGLLGMWGHDGFVVSTAVLTLRNLALVAFTIEVCRIAWGTLRHTSGSVQPVEGRP
jgi:hypothetical protein